ncbi:hypothetical protein [Lentilactobacillus parakefiri]|nr:hypothetical protein [Lentilactobacillus parakefiri]
MKGCPIVEAVNQVMFDAAATQYQLADKDFNSFKGTAGLSFSDQ